MSQRRLIDTNVILRHVVQDEPTHARIARALFDACDRGELTLVILPAVVAETVFVLESFYGFSPAEVAAVLDRVVSSPRIELTDADVHRDALREYAKGKLHFVDCELAAFARAGDLAVATFDQGFRKLPGVTVKID